MIRTRSEFDRGSPALEAPRAGTLAALARALFDAEPALEHLRLQTDLHDRPSVVQIIAPGVHISERARRLAHDAALPVGILAEYQHKPVPHVAHGTRLLPRFGKVTAFAWGATMPEAVARCGKLLFPHAR